MSADKSHEILVGGQFGSQAEAYLKSAVHAQGEDLNALIARMAGKNDARVLDLGCGGGHVTFNIAPLVREVVAYDLSPQMLEVVVRAARERNLSNIATEEGVAESLPFEESSFDAVLSRFSAHHWRDLEAGLREAARVLKPGGTIIMVDTVSTGIPLLDTFLQSIELLRDCSHVRNYSRAEWEAAHARAGLQMRSSDQFRLRLNFKAWVERMNTPKPLVDAIRTLQTSVSRVATSHYETEPDGSYTIDVGLFEAMKPLR